MRAAFFKGIRLWEACTEMPGWASRTGAMEHEGVRQTYKKGAGESPNFERPIDVRCAVDPQDPDAVPGYELGTAIENTLLDVETRLISEATTAGVLCFCEDDARRAAVTGSHSAGAGIAVGIGATGGGWGPAVGHKVLFRNKTTNAGFVTTITGVGSGTITCTLSADITNAWQVVRIERSFPETWFKNQSKALAVDATDPESFCREVTYSFICYANPDMPTGSLLPHDT